MFVRLSQALSILKTEMRGNLKPEFAAISIPSEFHPLLWILMCIYEIDPDFVLNSTWIPKDIIFYNACYLLTSLQTIHKSLLQLCSNVKTSEELHRWGTQMTYLPRTTQYDPRSLTDLKFYDSINHFFSLWTSLLYVLLFVLFLANERECCKEDKRCFSSTSSSSRTECKVVR